MQKGSLSGSMILSFMLGVGLLLVKEGLVFAVHLIFGIIKFALVFVLIFRLMIIIPTRVISFSIR
jgi:hypothetical protein